MTKLYKTYEVGSLAKPRWRVKGYAGRKLSEADIKAAKSWPIKAMISHGRRQS